MDQIPRAMTIAGSDSGAGAGIQADLKTFAALGVYGTSAITAITAQNTVGVISSHEVPTDLIGLQIEAILSDIGTDAIKTGMLVNSEIISVVAGKLTNIGSVPIVVDPVMVAKSGDSLLREDAIGALKQYLIPLATLITPNIPEAEALAEISIQTERDIRMAASIIMDLGASNVVIKGGHRIGPPVDTFFDGTEYFLFETPRIETSSTHGTGCTFASAVTAGLAKGLEMHESLKLAKEYVFEAIKKSHPIGHGHGPLNHFHGQFR